MKKIIFICFIFVLVVGASLIIPQSKDYDYLRLHIRANSNSVVDQNVKYEIKDMMVKYLTPYLCNVQSKENAEKIINQHNAVLVNNCIKILKNKGFNYSVSIDIRNEYFPTRTYSNTTLESGYYDVVIVELGEARGDNWWCVMYPPLCFVNKNENAVQIKYESKILQWFKKLF